MITVGHLKTDNKYEMVISVIIGLILSLTFAYTVNSVGIKLSY